MVPPVCMALAAAGAALPLCTVNNREKKDLSSPVIIIPTSDDDPDPLIRNYINQRL